MPTVLVILPEGFEEVEAVTPIDLWRRAGFTVTVAALDGKLEVTGRSNITLRADKRFSAISPEAIFDVLFFPGGPGVKHLRASPEVRETIGRHAMANKWITAICAAPTVLKDAGLLDGRRYTAHPSVATELPGLMEKENVVVDGHIVTSRGAGTALQFGLAVIQALEGVESADKVAISICAQSAS